MAPPKAPPYDPAKNQTFEAFVRDYKAKHPTCDLLDPARAFQVIEFLKSGSQVREKGQLFDKHFRAWVREKGFELINGSLQKCVASKEGTSTYLPVVTTPDVGRTDHGVHATLGKHVGQDKTKKLVRLSSSLLVIAARQGKSTVLYCTDSAL